MLLLFRLGLQLGQPGVHGLHQRRAALARRRRHEIDRPLPAQLARQAALQRLALGGREDVGLVHHQPALTLGELGIVLREFAADGLEVLDRVALGVELGDVEDVQQQLGAVDVPQERETEPCPLGRTFDDAGDVRDDKAAFGAERDDAEHRMQRRERVVRNFRARGGHAADQGRFAGVGQADQADVGEQFQFEPEFANLAWRALRDAAGRPVGAGLEVGVAEAVSPALRHEQLLAGVEQFPDQFSRAFVVDDRAAGHADRQIVAGLADAVPTGARLSVAGLEMTLETEVDEGVQACIRAQENAAAIAAVAAVRPAELDELLAPETQAAVAALAGGNVNLGVVDEFHGVRVPA